MSCTVSPSRSGGLTRTRRPQLGASRCSKACAGDSAGGRGAPFGALDVWPCVRHAASIVYLLRRSIGPAAIPTAPLQPAADLLHDGGCHLPAAQEAPGEQDRNK